MLYLSDEELEARLPEVIYKRMHDNAKPIGAKNIPLEQKAIIGALAKQIGPSAASEVLDVCEATASNAMHGRSTHKHGVNPELKDKLEIQTGNIRNIALEKLLFALSSIDESKVSELKPRDQAAIAKDLSSVADNMTDKSVAPNIGQVIVYSPHIREDFGGDVIEIGISKP